jgi:acetolactate synthase-1/2/3 large subunit
MIRVADYVADFIYKQGVRDVFMLSGGGSIFLDDGVACHKHLREVCVRNEATAPMMAEAYARLTQTLGVVYVTSGPGGANAVSGLSEAWVDSAPIMVISGQVQAKYASYNFQKTAQLRTFGTQELNIIDVVKSLTKYAAMVNDTETIRYHLEKAVHLARSGRPGPVWLDIPLDVQSAMVDEAKLKGYKPELITGGSKKLDENIEGVIRLLHQAKKPLIIAGQGVRIANVIPQFVEMVEKLNVPVVFSRLGQDIMPFSHKNCFGHGGMKGMALTGPIMKGCDLVISIGSRLSVPFIGEKLDAFANAAKIVMVDIDEAELKKPTIKIDVACCADAKIFIQKLRQRLNGEKLPNFQPWLKTCQNLKHKLPLVTPDIKHDPIDLYYFVSRLDALSGRNHIFVSDAGSSYYVLGQVLTFEKGQREITSGAFASMGLAISLAIGCCFAEKDAQVLAVTGDGSIELNIQELKTMSSYKKNIKLFVINNGGYVSIRNTQDKVCQGRYIGSDQEGSSDILDFQKVAIAFDLPYLLISSHSEVDEKIMEIISSSGPALIEVVCDNKQKIIEPKKEMI